MKGSKARTERGEFLFVVKENADGKPFIFTEPRRQTMPSLKEAFIAFDLPTGMKIGQAQTIADFMNRNLAGMSMTIFDTHPLYNLGKVS